MNCTCGAAERGEPIEAHARDCRIRTGFVPNAEFDPSVERAPTVPSDWRAQHRRRQRWANLRSHLGRRGFVRGALDAIGLVGFVIAGGMLHPIAGFAIFGVSCIAYSWRLDDDR